MSSTDHEEDTGAQVAPIVKLEEVAVTTGEENEDAILDLKAKLYRFDIDGNQWKERGDGSVRVLKHKETGKVRLLMRQSKTLKICANHLVIPTTSVQEHAGNGKSCVWHAADFSDGELKDEIFCIRFRSVENCKTFMETVQQVYCSCGLFTKTWTSWTRNNPGRRFIGCPNYFDPRRNCKYFEWIDPKLPNEWYKTTLFDLQMKVKKRNFEIDPNMENQLYLYEKFEGEAHGLREQIQRNKLIMVQYNRVILMLLGFVMFMFILVLILVKKL